MKIRHFILRMVLVVVLSPIWLPAQIIGLSARLIEKIGSVLEKIAYLVAKIADRMLRPSAYLYGLVLAFAKDPKALKYEEAKRKVKEMEK